jgi:predicted MFS family arabinose efflux permease
MASGRLPGGLHLPAIVGPFVTLGLVYGVWYSYSVLLVALVREFAWPRAVAAGAFSLFVVVHGGAGPLVGRLVESLGPRVVMVAGAFSLVVGLLLAAHTTAAWHLYLAFGVIAAAGTCAAGWVPSVVIVRRSHPERFGIAVGIASAGTGMGIVAVVPLAQLLIDTIGWRWTLRVLAAAILIWVLSGVRWFTRDRPREAAAPRAAAPASGSERAGSDWTLGMALRSWRFWGVALVFLAGGTATQTLLVHQVAYLVDKGVAALIAATVASVVGLASIGGKIAWGALSDSVGREVAFTLSSLCVVSAIGILALSSPEAPMLAYVYAVLMGVGYASSAPLPPAVVGRLFRGPHFSSIFGALQPATSIGGAVGAWAAGRIFDRTGSYDPALVMAVVIAAAAPILLWIVAPRRPHLPPAARQARA